MYKTANKKIRIRMRVETDVKIYRREAIVMVQPREKRREDGQIK